MSYCMKDAALQEMDNAEEMATQSTSDEDSEDDELVEHRRLQQALFEKEKVDISF